MSRKIVAVKRGEAAKQRVTENHSVTLRYTARQGREFPYVDTASLRIFPPSNLASADESGSIKHSTYNKW